MRLLRALGDRRDVLEGRRRGRRRAMRVPGIEGLEGRSLLSTLIVTNTNDDGQGSLRGTVAVAASGDVIRFSPAIFGQGITLTSGEIDPQVGLKIQGPGADKLTISANEKSSIFGFGIDNATFTVTGLTLREGNNGQGGAIHDDALGGLLDVEVCDLVDDNASLQGGVVGDARGGAIASSAPLLVDHCQFISDEAVHISGTGPKLGGKSLGGAIDCTALSLQITNSLFEYCSAGAYTGYYLDGPAYGGAVEWAPIEDGSSKGPPKGVFSSDRFTGDSVDGDLTESVATGLPVGGGAVDVTAGITHNLQLSLAQNVFQNAVVNGSYGVQGGLAEGGSVRLDASQAIKPTFDLRNNMYKDGEADGGEPTGPAGDAAFGGVARGGAVAALASNAISPIFAITNDQVINTFARGGYEYVQGGDLPSKGGDAQGGGIYLDAGVGTGARFIVSYTLMAGDHAVGGLSSSNAFGANGLPTSNGGGSGLGGGLEAFANAARDPSFLIYRSEFASCQAQGGQGGRGADVSATSYASVGAGGGTALGGGALFDAGMAYSSKMTAYGSNFDSDLASGGAGGTGGTGNPGNNGGKGGDGGFAFGGGLAIYQDLAPDSNGTTRPFTAAVELCQFIKTGAGGGAGGTGGAASEVANTSLGGGNGGIGGDGRGGGLWIVAYKADPSDVVTLDRDVLAGDTAGGGAGGAGGPGDQLDGGHGGNGGAASGGGLLAEFAGTVKLLKPVIIGCSAAKSAGGAGGQGPGGNGLAGKGGFGRGGGIASDSHLVGGTVVATAFRIISGNSASVSPDVDGPLGTI